jgi:hypothetical protein
MPGNMPTKQTFAGAQTPRAPSAWSVVAVCAMLAGATQPAMSGLVRSSAQTQSVTSWLCDTVSPPDSASSNSDNLKLAGNSAMPSISARLRPHRIRARRPFQSDLHNGLRVAGNEPIQQGFSDIIVAPREAAQPVSFLSPETTRGPPWAGDQNPRLFDGARDRPAPHPCASPPPSEFHLHNSSPARNAACSPIRSLVAGRVSASFRAAGLATKHSRTVHSKDQHEIQPSLADSRYNTKES